MANQWRRIGWLAACAASLAADRTARAVPQPPEKPAAPAYEASCAYVAPNSVDGYVVSRNGQAFLVRGEVRFVFASADSMSRPSIQVPADALVPVSGAARVARAQLAFRLAPGEECRFDVSGAVVRP